MEIHPERLQPSYNEKGEAVSPRLPANVKNFLIDIFLNLKAQYFSFV